MTSAATRSPVVIDLLDKMAIGFEKADALLAVLEQNFCVKEADYLSPIQVGAIVGMAADEMRILNQAREDLAKAL